MRLGFGVVFSGGVVVAKSLVNPIAVKDSFIRAVDQCSPVLDISYIRAVIESHQVLLNRLSQGPVEMEFRLDRLHFTSQASLAGQGDDWIRLSFPKLVPSVRASLRSFLSPKKVGESLIEDRRTDMVRHFHGLNESELWFEQDGSLLFTYLDPDDAGAQFVFHLCADQARVQAGSLSRAEYMELQDIKAELHLKILSDRDVYRKLSECRDVVTNFRPGGQMEYHLKQRLLKSISESLYSTSRRVDTAPVRLTRIAVPTPVSEGFSDGAAGLT